MKLCWEFTNMNVTLPNLWQMGIDPEDKAGSCCLWEFYFHLFPRPWRTKTCQGLIRACQCWCPELKFWFSKTLSLLTTKARGKGGLERLSGLLQDIQVVEFSSAERLAETCVAMCVECHPLQSFVPLPWSSFCIVPLAKLKLLFSFEMKIPSTIDLEAIHWMARMPTYERHMFVDWTNDPETSSSNSFKVFSFMHRRRMFWSHIHISLLIKTPTLENRFLWHHSQTVFGFTAECK